MVVGDKGRRHGSLHSDWWTGNAVELASSHLIAVYPVHGLVAGATALEKYNKRARYSLIVRIEAPDLEIDLSTPIVSHTAIVTRL